MNNPGGNYGRGVPQGNNVYPAELRAVSHESYSIVEDLLFVIMMVGVGVLCLNIAHRR